MHSWLERYNTLLKLGGGGGIGTPPISSIKDSRISDGQGSVMAENILCFLRRISAKDPGIKSLSTNILIYSNR